MIHHFVFVEPGHFHAALVLRMSSERVDNRIHVYSSVAEEFDAFSELVEAFNTRAESPTRWQIQHHDLPGTDPEILADRIATAHVGATVVLAGRNNTKLSLIAALASRGINVFADKPWLTDASQRSSLDQALQAPGIVSDIMTIRHEILSRLCHEVVRTTSVFGEFDISRGPAIELESVHHLYKKVNGRPLQRPLWYFDASIQGDGLVDIQSHMVEQALWFALDEASPQPGDLQLERAHRWPTRVDSELFQEITGANSWPGTLADRVKDDVLAYPCNGQLDWKIGAITVRQRAEWREREPEGGGDLHAVRLRGTRADVIVAQGPETGFRAEVCVQRHDGDYEAIQSVLKSWRMRFPDLQLQLTDHGMRLDAPAALDDGHESHFVLVRDRYLDWIESGALPASVAARINARYSLLATAIEQQADGEGR